MTEAKAQLEVIRHAELALASCIGLIKFPADLTASPKPVELTASVEKSPEGDWAASCPSN